jgi:general secretion pathway protein B
MSFILDALRKSERERQAGQVPGLPHLASETPKPQPLWLYAMVGVLLLVNLAVVAYWLLTRQETSPRAPKPAGAEASRAADQPIPTAIANPGLPTQANVQAPSAPTASPVVPTPAVAPPARTPPAPAAVAIEPATPPSVPANHAAARRSATESRRELPPAPGPGVASRERPQPAPRSRPAPYLPAGNDEPALAGIDDETASQAEASSSVTVRPWPGVRPGTPDLRDLPLDFQERIPPLKISMFAYSREPAERFVIIDMKKYRTGDRLPGNLLLLEIQAENLLLELDGQKFRVPRF